MAEYSNDAEKKLGALSRFSTGKDWSSSAVLHFTLRFSFGKLIAKFMLVTH